MRMKWLSAPQKPEVWFAFSSPNDRIPEWKEPEHPAGGGHRPSEVGATPSWPRSVELQLICLSRNVVVSTCSSLLLLCFFSREIEHSMHMDKIGYGTQYIICTTLFLDFIWAQKIMTCPRVLFAFVTCAVTVHFSGNERSHM